MTPDGAGDPFLAPRDPREEAACVVVREHLLGWSQPAYVFRQRLSEPSYTLVVPNGFGERVLTVPGANEADFMFHGEEGTSAGQLSDFILACIEASGADHLRLPLLTTNQANTLLACLGDRLRDWRFGVGLSAVAPRKRKTNFSKEPASFRRALSTTRRSGFTIALEPTLPTEEVRTLHSARWGANRGDSFFGMLSALLQAGCAELFTLRDEDGRMVASQFDIVGTTTRHFYHSCGDTSRAPGCGTAIMAASFARCTASPTEQVYSFGRGSERYKYRYADECLAWFEVRGFYAPVGA